MLPYSDKEILLVDFMLLTILKSLLTYMVANKCFCYLQYLKMKRNASDVYFSFNWSSYVKNKVVQRFNYI